MPVVKSATVAHTLTELHINLATMEGRAMFCTTVDGAEAGTCMLAVNGESLAALLGVVPQEGKTRAADIADVCYTAALDAGLFDGVIA